MNNKPHTYTITIQAPVKLEPMTPQHVQMLLANPANKVFIKSIEEKPVDNSV